MRTLAVIVTFILSLTSPQWTNGESCSEQNMKDCEMKAMEFLHSVNESDDGYNYFCDNLKNNSQCPLNVSDECKTQYPVVTTIYIEFFNEMISWCNRSSPDRKAWFKVAFCARMHKRQFQRCYKLKYKWFENGTFDCRFYDFVKCWSEQVLANCGKEAKEMSKYINDNIPEEEYQENCSRGYTNVIRNCWILNVLTFLSLLLISMNDPLNIRNNVYQRSVG